MGGVYTKVQAIDSLRPGDHVCIWDYSRWPISYQHHGIILASGAVPAEVKVCHVWSPLEGYEEAQADSCFRVSTLEEFLYNRDEKHLRLVEYHTSGLREIMSRWGEVHLSKSDLPEVVLARCKYLLGLGRGDFNIFKQNCEHAAHWCMTGEQWCKQSLTKAKGRVPFENRVPKEAVDELYREIEEIQKLSRSVVDSVIKLSNTKVYLRVNGSHYVRILESGQVAVVPQGDDPATCGRTAFRLECYSKVYNCIKVSFYHEESQRYMFSRSTFSCFRDLRMKKAVFVRGKTGLQWEYSSLGNLKSMNQHRRYVGIRDDGLLVDVSMRGLAGRVEFVPCEPAQGTYEPPDIDKVTRKFDHQDLCSIQSRSMRDFEASMKSSDPAALPNIPPALV
ncbi:hypothetical protein Poli38472_011536 [Pythium oligandrum]|uniref:LRAT domain-containing protein n=1 Tax=Pythium oligandrum TaxID=41045 RepID=A0A8K1CJA6_PYTOL|nr:hypothetical protein Poli38472_011536 [Pythium oligandrum]|eukprot:TMW64656.1 hypothetical protein Poli38472_011536 [Pythium oligandrum]